MGRGTLRSLLVLAGGAALLAVVAFGWRLGPAIATVTGAASSATPTPSPTATPVPPTPTPSPTPSPLEPLHRQLEDFVRAQERDAGNPNDMAITVIDLQTGEQISIDGKEKHRAGCTGKVFPAFKYVDDVQRGLQPDDDWFRYYLKRTVRDSNNADSYVFITRAGIRETNDYLRRIGIYDTLITHPPAYYGWHEDFGYTEPENWTTSDDLATIFAKLWRNELFTPWMSAMVIDVMTQGPYTPWEYGIILADSVPDGVRVSHKIGYTYGGWDPAARPDNVWNDGGIVIVERDGRTYAYAIAIMQQNLYWYGGGPGIGREANRMVFAFFNQMYGWGY